MLTQRILVQFRRWLYLIFASLEAVVEVKGPKLVKMIWSYL
jgi:hypothetical protein